MNSVVLSNVVWSGLLAYDTHFFFCILVDQNPSEQHACQSVVLRSKFIDLHLDVYVPVSFKLGICNVTSELHICTLVFIQGHRNIQKIQHAFMYSLLKFLKDQDDLELPVWTYRSDELHIDLPVPPPNKSMAV